MAVAPNGVVPSDEAVKLFNSIILKLNNDLVRTIKNANTKDFQAQRQVAIQRQLQAVIDESDKDVRSWLSVEIPSFYENGMFQGTKDLHGRGSKIAYPPEFAKVHKDAIRALINEGYGHMAQGMQGMSAGIMAQINDVTRENIQVNIGKGLLTGANLREIKKDIEKSLKKDGITALVDKGGKKWDLSTYGEMLARTRLTQAHNVGVVNQMQANNYDLVQVSSHYNSCPLCLPWQSKVLSVSGNSSQFPSLDEAESQGLFHPNCKHAITPYHIKYLDASVVWDAEQQKYVPYTELRANDFNRKALESTSDWNKNTFKYHGNSIVGVSARGSTEGMVKVFGQKFPSVTDPNMVIEQGITDRAIDDFARKMNLEFGYLDKPDFLPAFQSTLHGNKYKTFRALRQDLYAMSRSLEIPARRLSNQIIRVNQNFFNKGGAFSQIEKAYNVDKLGQILFANVGYKDSVSIPRDMWKTLKGSISVHNHPNNTPPSFSDMITAKKLKYSQMRVVGKDYTWIVNEPKKGWESVKAKDMELMYNVSKDELLDEYFKNPDKFKDPVSSNEFVFGSFAKNVGLDVNKIKTLK